MNRYRITPSDILYFRDGRDMHASESYTGSAMFPPPLTTLYGTLRSAILAKSGADFSSKSDDFGLTGKSALNVAGSRIKTGSLRILNFGISYEGRPLYSVPADVRMIKTVNDDLNTKYVVLRPQSIPSNSYVSGPMLSLAGSDSKEPLTESTGYLTHDDYMAYLDKGVAPKSLIQTSDLWITESRTHVAINSQTNTKAESKLFSIPFVRFKKNTDIIVDLKNDEDILGESGWLKLGGEGRAASYQRIPYNNHSQHNTVTTGFVRVVLTSQAPFTAGWLPDGWSKDSQFDFFGAKAKLMGCAINRYGIVGGWDLAKKRPKPSRRAVPTGSVYYLDLTGNIDSTTLTHASLCADPDDIKSGFGTFHLGRI